MCGSSRHTSTAFHIFPTMDQTPIYHGLESQILYIRVKISKSMIIRGNGATYAVSIDTSHLGPGFNGTSRCQSNPHGQDAGLQRNRRPMCSLVERWQSNAPTRTTIENKQNSGPVDVGIMPIGTARCKMASTEESTVRKLPSRM